MHALTVEDWDLSCYMYRYSMRHWIRCWQLCHALLSYPEFQFFSGEPYIQYNFTGMHDCIPVNLIEVILL